MFLPPPSHPPGSIPGQLEDALDGVDRQDDRLGVQTSPRHVDLQNIGSLLLFCPTIIIVIITIIMNVINVEPEARVCGRTQGRKASAAHLPAPGGQ